MYNSSTMIMTLTFLNPMMNLQKMLVKKEREQLHLKLTWSSKDFRKKKEDHIKRVDLAQMLQKLTNLQSVVLRLVVQTKCILGNQSILEESAILQEMSLKILMSSLMLQIQQKQALLNQITLNQIMNQLTFHRLVVRNQISNCKNIFNNQTMLFNSKKKTLIK